MVITFEELSDKRQYWKTHPADFMKDMLGLNLAYHQKKMLEAIVKHNNTTIRSANAVGKCVADNELIISSNGTIELAQNLPTNFEILSFEKDTGNQTYENATCTDNGFQDCYKISTQGGREIVRTYNHPILCGHLERDYSFKDEDGRRLTIKPFNDGWKECQYITQDDLVLVPNKINIKENDIYDFSYSDCKLLGYLLGDGCTSGNTLSFTQQDNKVLKEFIDIIKENDCAVNLYKKTGCKATDVRISKLKNKNLHNPYVKNNILEKVKQWDLYGKLATTKSFPKFTHSLPLKKLSTIINRLFSCDGYVIITNNKRLNVVYPNGYIGITLASKLMIQELQILLLRFGINSSFRYKPSKYKDKIFDAWELTIRKTEDVKKFIDKINIFDKENKTLQLKKILDNISYNKTKKWHKLNCPQDYHWEKVKKVEYIGKVHTNCISVNNTHTFLTTICEHNSTLLSATAIWFWYCYLEDDVDNTIVLFTAPNFAQVRENVYNPIRAFISEADRRLKDMTGNPNASMFGKLTENKNLAEIRYGNKNYIMGVSTEGENKNVGKHGTYVLCIFDEAQGISDNAFSDFEGITSSGLVVKKVMIGNTTLPNGNFGTFFNSFKDNSEWHQIKISCFDTPNFINPDIKLDDFLRDEKDPKYWRNKLDKYCGTNYNKSKANDELSQWETDVKKALLPFSKWLINPIQAYRILMEYGGSPDSYEFKTRCLAEFPSGNENAVFPQDWINQSMINYNNDDCWQPGEIQFGIDIGNGVGNDKSAISIRNGNKIIFSQTYNLELFDLIDKIKELNDKYNPSKICIELDGIGRDKYLILQDMGLPVQGIQMGGGAGIQNSDFIFDKEGNDRKKQDFFRKRDEVWFDLRKLLNPFRPKLPETEGKFSLLLPDITMLRQELSSITYSKNESGKIKVVSKEELRKKLSRSTDLADSIAFACYGLDNDFYMPCNFGAINIKNDVNNRVSY